MNVENQAVGETQNPCITDAAKPKSLGQVGYEAMLAAVDANPDIPGFGEEREWWEDDARMWENQPPQLRADWESVGAAIAKAVQP